jgi:hypothetical protein
VGSTRQNSLLQRINQSLIIAAAVLLLAVLIAWAQGTKSPDSGEQIAVPGMPVPADRGRLSERNLAWLKIHSPQAQMEFLLEEAVNHDTQATDLIPKYLDRWRGKLTRSERWQDLEQSALYSSDLRVRAAAIEINLVVNGFAKNSETAGRLLDAADKDPSYRTWYEWELGMLANRGVEKDKIYQALSTWTHDRNEKTRFWAVEGLAHIGSDDTIKNFLDVLRNDPSMQVRERAGCSLAKSGMLTREQRMKAVPGLLELTDDPSLDSTTRLWVYQALRQITDETLPNDPATWRDWYSAHGSERNGKSKPGPEWALLGNS